MGGSNLHSTLRQTSLSADKRAGETAGQSSGENYDFTTKIREQAANNYMQEATRITNQQAAANNEAGRVQRVIAAGGVETACQQQVQGVPQAYGLTVQANQVNLDGALNA